MIKVAISSLPFNSHLFALLPWAGALKDLECELTWLIGPGLEKAIQAAQMPYVSFGKAPATHKELHDSFPIWSLLTGEAFEAENLVCVMGHWFASSRYIGLYEWLKKNTPDLLVIDSWDWAACIAAKELQIPTVAIDLGTTAKSLTLDFTQEAFDLIAESMPRPQAWQAEALIYYPAFFTFSPALLRHKKGFTPETFIEARYEHWEELSLKEPWQGLQEHFGLKKLQESAPYWSQEAPKRFLMSTSSVFQSKSFFTKKCQAVDEIGAHTLLLGLESPTCALHSPWTFYPFAPLAPLVKECDLYIHHGGWGSELCALAFGKPTLCWPEPYLPIDFSYLLEESGLSIKLPAPRQNTEFYFNAHTLRSAVDLALSQEMKTKRLAVQNKMLSQPSTLSVLKTWLLEKSLL